MSAPLFLAPEYEIAEPPPAPRAKPTAVADPEALARCAGDSGKDVAMRTGLMPPSPLNPVVAAQLDGAHFLRPFIVQTCGHTPSITEYGERMEVCDAGDDTCRELTALILAGTLDNPVLARQREALTPIAERAGAPLFALQYSPLDHASPVVATRNGEKVADDLREFRLALTADQAAHFESEHPDCHRPEGRSDRRRVSTWSEPLERTLRKVPTSRVVSVNGALACDKCGDLIALVDVRPLSESHRRNRVPYLLALAKRLDIPVVLIEHHDNPSRSRSSRALVYRDADWKTESVVEGSMYDMAGVLYDVIDGHSCSSTNVGGH